MDDSEELLYIEGILEKIGFICDRFQRWNKSEKKWDRYLHCFSDSSLKFTEFDVEFDIIYNVLNNTYYFSYDSEYDEHLRIALTKYMLEKSYFPEIILKDTCRRFYNFERYGTDKNLYDNLFEKNEINI